MSTTGTYTYNPTATVLITDALRLLTVIEEGNSASTTQVTDSIPAFQMYIKSLGKYGLNLWANETQSITLVASTCSYSPTKKILRVTDAVFRDSDGEDTTLLPLSREEYWNLSDKDQTGQPTQFYYNPQEDAASSLIYVWPCPTSDYAGSGETIELGSQILLEDIGDGTNEIDVPQEWLETIKYGLATRLAPMYGYPTSQRRLLFQEYTLMLKENLDFDTEQESIFILPDNVSGGETFGG